MKDILTKIGLKIKFEYKFELSQDKTIKILMDKNLDEKIYFGERIFNSTIPITTKDFVINNNSFTVSKNRTMNPLSGKGKIIGDVISTGPNDTKISGTVISNIDNFNILIYITIFVAVLWSPFIYFGMAGLEWILILLAFFIFGTIWSTIFQRFEVKKVKKDFDRYLTRLIEKK